MIFPNRGCPQGNINNKGDLVFAKTRGRPQGNINKKDSRDFLKSRPKMCELFKMLKPSLDTLDRLYRAVQVGFLGTV